MASTRCLLSAEPARSPTLRDPGGRLFLVGGRTRAQANRLLRKALMCKDQGVLGIACLATALATATPVFRDFRTGMPLFWDASRKPHQRRSRHVGREPGSRRHIYSGPADRYSGTVRAGPGEALIAK